MGTLSAMVATYPPPQKRTFPSKQLVSTIGLHFLHGGGEEESDPVRFQNNHIVDGENTGMIAWWGHLEAEKRTSALV